MNKPFVIAPTYLQQSCAVGQIERHFFSGLSDIGYNPIIISAQNNISPTVFNHSIIELKENPIWGKLDLALHRFALRDLTHCPDFHYYSLRKRILRIGQELAKSGQIDYIHTINNPVSSHVLGLELKKITGLPLVVQLFDPWHNNPFRAYKHQFFDKIDEKWETEIANSADIIIFPNEELLLSWESKYGLSIADKTYVLPFCTELPIIKDIKYTSEKIVISHIGTLSKERNSSHFLRALERFNTKYPNLSDKLLINFVGSATKEEVNLAHSLNLDNQINFVGRISEAECAYYYEHSDIFLIIDIDCTPNLFYPSKLLKYFCYRKPIIGLTKDDSVVFHELSKTGNFPVQYEDESAIVDILFKAVSCYESINKNDKEYGNRFSVRSVCSQFNTLICNFNNGL